jgi:hypothetical protein
LKRIVILMHEYQRRWCKFYLIQALGQAWKKRGLDVSYVYGIRDHREADLLIPHIDLTRTPADYVEYIGSYSNVINRDVIDIAKRRISQHLLREDEDYPDPVIVKTDNNYGGIPERRSAWHKYPLLPRFYTVAGRMTERVRRPDLASTQVLYRYPIYENLAAVPRDVFRNRELVVERFLPEKEGPWYFMRHYLFLGDRTRNVRVAGRDAFLKRFECVPVDNDLPVPDELIDLRRRLGFDYGKFDYMMHNGQVVILDVNRTVGKPGSPGATAVTVGNLSDGIWSLLADK